MDEGSFQSIHQRMDKLSEQLSKVQKTVERQAVQDEQIRNLQDQVAALWVKMDKLHGSDGVLQEIRSFQASCPRRHIWAMWIIIVPMGLALLKFVYGT